MGWDQPWHWIVLGVVVIALFGYKKLPDASRALGRSLRIFKTEIKGMGQDDKARDAARDAAGSDADAAPRAETVRRPEAVAPPAIEAPRTRPRPTPSPNGRPRVESDASGPGAAR